MFSSDLFPFIILLFGSLTGLYYCYTNFQNLKAWNLIASFSKNNQPKDIFFSVLVPARNESANIISCIKSLLAQDYESSQFEIIFIDDHSTDDTLIAVQQNFGNKIKVVTLEEENVFGKKAAIKKGIELAKGNWIITTDADCRVGAKWLQQFKNCIDSSSTVFCCAPVEFTEHNTSLEIFQQLDIMGMMGVTAGGIHRKAAYLANGANLAYKKSVFNEVNGFEGITEKASGDDMLLLQKFVKKYPNQISFIKSSDAIVWTPPERNISDFFSQRLRWASKGNAFPNFGTWLQMVLVFFFNFILLVSLLFALFQPYIYLKIFLGFYLLKFVSDYFYLSKLSKFFDKEALNKHIWWGSFAYAIYIVMVGLWAQVYKSYDWKGRKTQ